MRARRIWHQLGGRPTGSGQHVAQPERGGHRPGQRAAARPRSSDTLALAMSRSSLTDRRPGVKTTSVTPV